MLAAGERQGKAHLLADIFHSRALERLAAAAHCHAELLVFQLVHLFREDEIDPHALSAGGEPELVDASEIGAAILLIADADGCIADGRRGERIGIVGDGDCFAEAAGCRTIISAEPIGVAATVLDIFIDVRHYG